MRNMMTVDEKDRQYACNKIQLDGGGYNPEYKTQITKYLVRKGIIGCICDMLWRDMSNKDDAPNINRKMSWW